MFRNLLNLYLPITTQQRLGEFIFSIDKALELFRD